MYFNFFDDKTFSAFRTIAILEFITISASSECSELKGDNRPLSENIF
jgi:hypothetical protein